MLDLYLPRDANEDDNGAQTGLSRSELLAASVNRIGMEGTLGSYERFAITTAEGLMNTPRGILAAAAYNLENPMEMVKTVAGSAILAAGLKTILPEAGPVGKIAGTIMGVYFVYSAAPEFIEAYRMGQHARTWDDMHAAGARWGHAAGHLTTNTVLGAAGYKIGAGLSGRILLSERLDGFADFKQNFWDSALGRSRSLLRMSEPLETAALSQRPNFKIDGDRAILTDTTAQANTAGARAPVNPDAQLSSMVMVNSKASALRMERYIARMAQGRSAVLTDELNAFQERFGAREDSLAAVKSFADRFNLKVLESDARSGRVILDGKASDFQQAFGIKLESVTTGNGSYVDHRGAISIPKELAPHVRAVFGMDESPIARPAAMVSMTPRGSEEGLRIQQQETTTGGNSSTVDPANFIKQGGYTAAEIARAQNFPLATGGEGQHGAFISLGGGIDLADYSRFFSNRGLPQPKPLRIVEVGRGRNTPGNASAGDVENALDGLIMQTVAPKANVSMIISSNDARGFVESFERGIFPKNGEAQNSVLSSSWGLWERSQLKPVTTSLSILLKQATIRGMQVFAAAGDNGAGNASLRFGYQPEYPAADPNVVSVGGLKTVIGENGKFSYVTAWNEGFGSATGGGVSTVFALPWWQRNVNVPPHRETGRRGRGVPDIAANSAKATGYAVRSGGADLVIGGTSAGAPLYAGLMLNINAELAAGGIKPVAPLNPWLYSRAGSAIFNEVTTGSNFGYDAAPGWNPVTGFGWVDGKALLEAMRRQ